MAKIVTGFDQWINRAIERGEHNIANRLKIERAMAQALVEAILARGAYISVNDGGEWVVRSSRNLGEVMLALGSTDDDQIIARDEAKNRLGWFHLVYGNDGYDVVSNYTANPFCDELWNTVIQPLADKFEKGATPR